MTERDIKIGETAAKIMQTYCNLEKARLVFSVSEGELNNLSLCNLVARMAVEFEDRYPYFENWENVVEEYAKKRFLELFRK